MCAPRRASDICGSGTPRTRAVIGVDLFGQVAPFPELEDCVANSDVLLIEDAAQSQGARREGRLHGMGTAHGLRQAAGAQTA